MNKSNTCVNLAKALRPFELVLGVSNDASDASFDDGTSVRLTITAAPAGIVGVSAREERTRRAFNKFYKTCSLTQQAWLAGEFKFEVSTAATTERSYVGYAKRAYDARYDDTLVG
jgi:hypothetical protein